MRFEISGEGISPVNQRGRVSYSITGTDKALEDFMGKRLVFSLTEPENSVSLAVEGVVNEAHVLYIAAGHTPYVRIAPASKLYQSLIHEGATIAMEIATFPNGKQNHKVLAELRSEAVATAPTKVDELNASRFGIGSLLDIYESIRPIIYSAVIDVIPGYRPSILYGDLKKHVINYPLGGTFKDKKLLLSQFENGLKAVLQGIVGPYIVTDEGYFNWLELTNRGGVIEEVSDNG